METRGLTGASRAAGGRRLALAVAAACAALLGALTAAGVLSPSARSASIPASHLVRIRVLSNRADLISGGDALVEVILPRGASAKSVRVDVDGRDVTRAFDVRANGKLEGLVTGLKNGPNVLTAILPDGYGAYIDITNHPIGGPIFAGPQIQPWTCQNTDARDKQCNQPPTYTYSYKPSNGGSLQPYDPKNPPPDSAIAKTTTTDGVTVPFIVRQEVGYIDRDQYAIAALWQPGKPWEPYAPQRQYNGRLVIKHGASCDTEYQTGDAPAVNDEPVLGAGFIVMSNALDNAGHDCNILVQAESLLMTKEYVVDHYGEIRWTIGSGCSGGSLVQQQVANAYPGIYQGITPQCSFTDAWSSAMEYVDYLMLLRYWQDPSRWDPGTVWTPAQMSAVLDHPNVANPITFTDVIPFSGDPDRSSDPLHRGCPGVPSDQLWSPSNTRGVRCTLQDYTVNLFGRRPGDGYANEPLDNTGIQYGLKGLRQGLITPSQFVDLNTHIGGLDINGDVQPQRFSSDLPGLERAYVGGAINEANNLNRVAIIDLRGPDPGAFHDVYRTYAMRERLLRNFGTAANQVLWRGQVALLGDPSFADQAIFAEDRWLGRVHADHRDIPLSRKIIEDKPDNVADRCTDGSGHEQPSEVCDQTVASYGTPRFGADEPKTDDVVKCQLKPMRRDDYPVSFTDEQWSRLQAAFPGGVCDYSKPGVLQQPTRTWRTYQDSAGRVIYGGKPLGPAPESIPFGPGGKCVNRRKQRFRIHQPRRGRVVSVTAWVKGKKRKTVHRRRIKSITLRHLPSGTFTVRIVARTNRHSRTVSVRGYRACKKGRVKHKTHRHRKHGRGGKHRGRGHRR